MSRPGPSASLEEQIEAWRSYLRRAQAVDSSDVAELEDHLREQIDVLTASGLTSDEAFLIAVKRIGNLDALSREFAREHSERLWKQLVVAPADSGDTRAPGGRTDTIVAFLLAAVAGMVFTTAIQMDLHNGWYRRNLTLFVLPLLAGYFAWKRRLGAPAINALAMAFVVAAVFANVYPFMPLGSVEALTALHLPIVLWLLVGIAYAGRRWRDAAGRMDFIRFSGELLIYCVLIALGGAVLTLFMLSIFAAIGINAGSLFESWLLPCGAAAGVFVASWLVEAKQSVIESMAPVLTRLFTPLFTAVLLTFLGALLWTGRGVGVERNVLIAFDLLLALVLALLLYSVSARAADAPPGAFDHLQVVLLVSALITNAVALWAIAVRITEFGFTANRVAALGENAVLLVNLTWSAVLYIRFLRGRGSFAALERWQTDYMPVYAAWAAMVVIFFPPLFRYV